MPEQKRGSRYLERAGIIPTYRNPEARIMPGGLKIHQAPEGGIAPLPLPALQDYLNGDPEPDRGQTLDWPHPRRDADDE